MLNPSCRTFSNPTEFIHFIESETVEFTKYDCIVIDKYFDNDMSYDGIMLAKYLKTIDIPSRLFISSNDVLKEEEIKLFSKSISKNPREATKEIERYLAEI